MKGLRENDYSFSERDLVTFFRGEHREMLRYIIDAVRHSITHNKGNRLMEFVEWAAKSAARPLAYANVEKTFFAEFLYMNALDSSIDEGMERGRSRHRSQPQGEIAHLAVALVPQRGPCPPTI